MMRGGSNVGSECVWREETKIRSERTMFWSSLQNEPHDHCAQTVLYLKVPMVPMVVSTCTSVCIFIWMWRVASFGGWRRVCACV